VTRRQLTLGGCAFFFLRLHYNPVIASDTGNPGLLDFYVPFLDAIHREATSHSPGSPESPVTIFAHAHLGLSSYVGGGAGASTYPETAHVALPAQIQAHLEFLDELLAAHAPTTRVLLVGHSIGAWFVQEMLKARAAALRPRVGAFFLFPTMSHIGLSPNGRMLSVRVSATRFVSASCCAN
jgi:pimeloyl-ACP methyl ester carboxylesterase